jgi:hypothetical protein
MSDEEGVGLLGCASAINTTVFDCLGTEKVTHGRA